MNFSRDTWFRLTALASFVAAYRFIAHGVTLKDHVSLGIGYAALAVGLIFVVMAFRTKRHE
ncbi:hypothetical protein GC163_11240 [bacterium]|nr:hypothetical protein [bacterium]